MGRRSPSVSRFIEADRFFTVWERRFSNWKHPQYLADEAYARYGFGGDASPADFADVRYQNDRVGHPADANYWKQVVAKCEFKDKKLARVDLYPLDLGFGKPRWQRGRPLLADEKLGREIIEKVAGLSRRRGTEVKWQDGRGVILFD